jgi:BirA family transcriptional regulator, biotin operon repressor / biotin---[acetyl-CoA-carboxylase] ligase
MQADPYASTRRALAGTPHERILYKERTASTNEDAVALLDDDASLGTTIVAEEQTQGAGRRGRTWTAGPQSALLFTTLLSRELFAADLWIVPFWTALTVRDALSACGVSCDLQWPNDLLLGQRKLAGILCVSRVTGDRARVGCGVGINVRRDRRADEIAPSPAFCDDVVEIDRAALLAQILNRFWMRMPMLDLPDQVARRWEREAGLPGRHYRLQRDNESSPFDATAVALSDGGGLVVERDGRQEIVSLADARVLR